MGQSVSARGVAYEKQPSLIAMLDGINIELKAPSGLDPVFEPSTPLRP